MLRREFITLLGGSRGEGRRAKLRNDSMQLPMHRAPQCGARTRSARAGVRCVRYWRASRSSLTSHKAQNEVLALSFSGGRAHPGANRGDGR